MKNISRLSLRLLLICAIAALLLGVTNYFTKGPIEEQRIASEQADMKASLKAADSFQSIDENMLETIKKELGEDGQCIVKLSRAQKDGQSIGMVASLSVKGDQGAVAVTVGVDSEGTVTGVRVGNNSETPGLGKKVEQDSFLEQYNGKSSEVELTKFGGEIDAISGATHSSSAVTKAVNIAFAAWQQLGGMEAQK